MKKNILFVSALLVLLPTLTGCPATHTRRSFGEVVDDGMISNKLKVKYLKDKEIKGFQINVDTWRGVVSLQGRVNTQEQINRSIEIAEQQKGVREVKSYLLLKDEGNKSNKSRIKERDVKK